MTQIEHIISSSDLDFLEADIKTEIRQAEDKFPKWPTSLAEGIQIITEELGETAQAANEWRWQNAPIEDVRTELIQTAAMCIRQISMIDKFGCIKPKSGGCPHSG